MKKTRSPGQADSKGFSLIELLITLALIVVMAVMLTSRGSLSYQQKQFLACQKNLQNIFVALSLYATDNEGAYPKVADATSSEAPLSLLVPRCTTATEIFICPGSKDSPLKEGEPFADSRISYAYYSGYTNNAGQILLSDRQVDTRPKKAGEKIFSNDGKKPGDNHHKHGGNILFAGGDVRKFSSKAPEDLLFPTNIILLNPKPK